MMGTLSAVLCRKKIRTVPDFFKAEVTGDIENMNGILKITRIKVHYFLKVPPEKRNDAQEALENYISLCPGAQSVIGCIDIQHDLTMEDMQN